MLVLVNEFDAGMDVNGNPRTAIRIEFLNDNEDVTRYTNIIWRDSSYLGKPPSRPGNFDAFNDVNVNDDDKVVYVGSYEVTEDEWDTIENEYIGDDPM